MTHLNGDGNDITEYPVTLESHLGSVLNGSMPFSTFIAWFNSAEWETRMTADSAALRVCWDIQNVLYQIEDDPHHVERELLRQELTRLKREIHQVINASPASGRVT